MARYRIVEHQPDHYIIVNANDEALAWAGSHWFFIGESGPQLTSFASREAAVHYAEVVFGGSER
jgi:hypothetical protein